MLSSSFLKVVLSSSWSSSSLSVIIIIRRTDFFYSILVLNFLSRLDEILFAIFSENRLSKIGEWGNIFYFYSIKNKIVIRYNWNIRFNLFGSWFQKIFFKFYQFLFRFKLKNLIRNFERLPKPIRKNYKKIVNFYDSKSIYIGTIYCW